MTSTTQPATGGNLFAAMMFTVLGIFNLIDGFVLLRRGNFIENHFVASNADTWGWILIVFAVFQLIAGFGAMSGTFGRTIGLSVALIGMTFWFMLLFVSPFAALIGIFINYMLIGSLVNDEA